MEWTKEPPTVEGWYWHRNEAQDIPPVLLIVRKVGKREVLAEWPSGVWTAIHKGIGEWAVAPDSRPNNAPVMSSDNAGLS